ncbi:Rpn family recombination-promoting nuclease/putative transposase [Wolbachia endosymbiont of Chironomus riparius]|uniref:Rpn family recombination-promoting nuclease/putative transposase n=1 Tax=Wolbachia endosymbiont of Chironomus riparius TaxID=2883238 RepID=UPI00209E6456|nr:Rpn family recombination-promoting nuclease/putative transposase [Wolbachia endosymbiont of Chironomus riparius]
MAFTKFLDPKCDLTFKRIFGSEKNKNILIHFLNDILEFKGQKEIEEVEFLSTIMDPEIASDKQSIVDILCKDSIGNRFVIEMQVAKDKGFEKRAQLYAAKAYSRQLDKSGKYIDLKKVYFIAISNNDLFPEEVSYKSSHTIRDIETNGHYLKDLQFIFIELTKFQKSKVEELENIVERWCYFFKYAEETTDEDLKKIAEQEPIIKLAYNELDKSIWTEKDLVAYEERILDIQKEAGIWAQRLDDAKALGREQGREEGKEEGGKEKAELIARNLLKLGVSTEIIAKTTGFSSKEIEKLK